MEIVEFSRQHADAVQKKRAEETAKVTGRGQPNFEDQIRAATNSSPRFYRLRPAP